MKSFTSILCVITCVLFSCENDTVNSANILNGTYTGQFYRSSPNAHWKTAQVTLTFKDGTYTGVSDTEKYPALCTGTVVQDNLQAEFKNDCVWTAEFDWSFILSGTFQLSKTGNKLTITRTYDQQVSDTYELIRQ